MAELNDIPNTKKCWICKRTYENGLGIQLHEGVSFSSIPICDVCSDLLCIPAISLVDNHEKEYHGEII